MKREQPNTPRPKDTPATRKKRLAARLQEISDKSEQELRALTKSLDKVRSTFRPQKPGDKR